MTFSLNIIVTLWQQQQQQQQQQNQTEQMESEY